MSNVVHGNGYSFRYEWHNRKLMTLGFGITNGIADADETAFELQKADVYKLAELLLDAIHYDQFTDANPHEQIVNALQSSKIEYRDGSKYGFIRRMTPEEHKNFVETTPSDEADITSVKYKIEFLPYRGKAESAPFFCSASRILDNIYAGHWVVV